jgi:hypothetical protein
VTATRHLVPVLMVGLVLGGSLATLDRIGRVSTSAGVVWMLSIDPVLRALPDGGEARVLGAWFSGRLVQVHVESLRGTVHLQVRGALLLRLPDAGMGWSGCG